MEITIRSFFQSLSEYINTEIHPAILHAITLLIPVNIYVIGDWLGAGIQWPLFRYQETYLGTSFIPIFREIAYVLHGALRGKSAVSTGLWVLGALLLVLALILSFWRDSKNLGRTRAFLLLPGSLLLLISTMIQYGLFLHGPAGFTIPIGIPILLFLGLILIIPMREPFPEKDIPGATPE